MVLTTATSNQSVSMSRDPSVPIPKFTKRFGATRILPYRRRSLSLSSSRSFSLNLRIRRCM